MTSGPRCWKLLEASGTSGKLGTWEVLAPVARSGATASHAFMGRHHPARQTDTSPPPAGRPRSPGVHREPVPQGHASNPLVQAILERSSPGALLQPQSVWIANAPGRKWGTHTFQVGSLRLTRGESGPPADKTARWAGLAPFKIRAKKITLFKSPQSSLPALSSQRPSQR